MSGNRMLVAKEARKDLANAQKELEEALAAAGDNPELAKSCIRLARAHIADAMRRLG